MNNFMNMCVPSPIINLASPLAVESVLCVCSPHKELRGSWI